MALSVPVLKAGCFDINYNALEIGRIKWHEFQGATNVYKGLLNDRKSDNRHETKLARNDAMHATFIAGKRFEASIVVSRFECVTVF